MGLYGSFEVFVLCEGESSGSKQRKYQTYTNEWESNEDASNLNFTALLLIAVF